jgi:hypothetical protein
MESAVTARGIRLDELIGRLRWGARLAWEDVAWPEFLAVAALVLGAGVEFWVNNPLRQELRELRAYTTTAKVDSPAELAVAPERGSADLVAGFMAFLPATGMREQQMQTLHSLASESGVALARVEYGHARLEHLPGQRMTMQLSVSAEYGPYRKFLHNLLVAMPNLSIDRVTMERAPGPVDKFNIRLETSLYYRVADPGSAR